MLCHIGDGLVVTFDEGLDSLSLIGECSILEEKSCDAYGQLIGHFDCLESLGHTYGSEGLRQDSCIQLTRGEHLEADGDLLHLHTGIGKRLA